jgi:hypothetical protein
MKKHTLKNLREWADLLGVKIIAVRDDTGWGYWLENTGWEDGNFCTSHDEIYACLRRFERELAARTVAAFEARGWRHIK